MLRIYEEFSCPGSMSRSVVHIIRAATYDELCGIPHNSSNRTCGFPASGSPVGSCISHTERRSGAASSHRRSLAVPVALRAPGSQKLHGFTRGAPLRRVARPVDALTAPSLQSVSPAPSLTHVMLWDSPPLRAGFVGRATPAGFRPAVIPPHLRPLSSTGVTPRLQYYGPLRHPAGPACPSRGPGCRVHGTGRASRVATPSIFHACRRHYPRRKPAGALVALFPAGRRPSPFLRRVGFRDARFEACSAFTRVPACMVAEPPKAALYQCASIHVVTSMNRSGRYQLERQLLGGIRTQQENAPFHGALRNAG